MMNGQQIHELSHFSFSHATYFTINCVTLHLKTMKTYTA